MANTFTANYNLTKPEVGAATNTWGGLLNTNFDTIDTQIKARDTQAAAAQATANAALPKAGGTMEGFITLHANPTSNFHPATKQYVDAFLLKSGGVMTGYVTLHAAPTDIMHPANKKYVDDAVAQAQIQAGAGLPLTGGTMQGFITLSGAPTSSLHAATKAYVDAGDSSLNTLISAKVSKAGDTLTGPLLLSADPTSGSDPKTATTKNYVDSTFLSRSGGTMTGAITLAADPTADMHPVTRKFFTDNALTRAGGTLTNYLTLFADPVQALHPVTLQYLQANTFSRTQTASQSMSGPLVLSADPTGLSSPLQAATKNYVDTAAVPRAGTGATPMTGHLSLVGDPTQSNHAATKAYVDAANYLDPDLKTISGLTGAGYLKRESGGSWLLDPSGGTSSTTITISGDASGIGTSAISLTLANSGVQSGTYNSSTTTLNSFTVDSKGRITSVGSAQTITPAWSSITGRPTTISGFGITDAFTQAAADGRYIAGTNGSFTGTLSGGSISFNSATGAITSASLSTGTGNISGGAILGTSLNVGFGSITGGAITATSITGLTSHISLPINNPSSVYQAIHKAYADTLYLSSATASSTYLTKDNGAFTGSMTGGTITLNAGTGAINCSTLTATTDIVLSSDARLKEDVRQITNALEMVNMLRGVSYVMKDTRRSSIGVIAQEVERVVPALVHTDEDGYKAVAYANMVGILIEAVKELTARVEELEAR